LKNYKSYIESLVTDRKQKTVEAFESSQKILTLDETVDFIKENCKEFLKYPVKIKRSIFTFVEEHYLYIEPVERHSLENLDFYNLIIDNDPSWEGYPKRLKSLCCTLRGRPSLGNRVYYVIPVDGSKWGLCSGSDLFISFKYLEEKTNNLYMNELFNRLYDNILHNPFEFTYKDELINDFEFDIKLDDTNYELFKKQIDTVDSILNKYPDLKEKFMNDLFKYYKYENIFDDTLFNIIINLMDPIKNNFKIQTLQELYNSSQYNKEVWTESPCILIYENAAENVFDKLDIQIQG
jgi:hypothetical protein